VTNPQGPPHGDPTVWSRPANQVPPVYPPPPPGRPGYPPTPGDPSSSSTSKGSQLRRLLRDPLSIVLIVVIVLALVAAGLLAGELYARHLADSKVAAATECVVQDKASVSFGVLPPFLLQHMSGHYTNISISTAGNQIRGAKGMKADVSITDVRLQSSGNSKGTIGALDATVTWSSDGIKQTIQSAIPLLGGMVSDVKTNPSAGTIELGSGLGNVTAKPVVATNGLSLQVVQLGGLGFTLPSEIVQPALDAFTTQLTQNYPLGIHADSVQVTDTGVVSHFSTRNASIPQSSTNACFANL
jgi:hypothetical protein